VTDHIDYYSKQAARALSSN